MVLNWNTLHHISFILSLHFVRGEIEPPIVQTKYGSLEGLHDGISRDGRKFYQFRGVQYAVVEERFKPSVEPPSWNGTKSAKEFGKACNSIYKHGDENCLFLNVYTESLGMKNGVLRPVVMFIHGGAFQAGSGNNVGPNYLIDEGIVLVTIDYRLGILGFLSTEDSSSPGNYGLKDQVMALRWIQDNIAEFGGDKNKVTIMGQSAGAASVTYHLVSPMSKGLFRNAIAQSGSLLDPWQFTRKPLRYARKLAELLDCNDTKSGARIVDCLRKVEATTIGQRQLARNATVKFLYDPLAGFGPVIEPCVGDCSNSFLSTSPYELLVSGNVAKVPLLAGLVKEEGIYLWAATLLLSQDPFAIAARQNLHANWSTVAPLEFYFDEKTSSERLTEVSEKIKKFYFGSKFSLDVDATFSQLSHLYSDRWFVASVVRFMNLFAKQAPTYPYLYTFNKFVGIEFSLKEQHAKFSLDATHAAELDMLFSPLFNRTRVDPVHDQVSKSITKLWASFMKNGIPSATYGSERTFSAINPEEGLQRWYRLDTDTELIGNIFAERIKFWESLQLSDDDFLNCYC